MFPCRRLIMPMGEARIQCRVLLVLEAVMAAIYARALVKPDSSEGLCVSEKRRPHVEPARVRQAAAQRVDSCPQRLAVDAIAVRLSLAGGLAIVEAWSRNAASSATRIDRRARSIRSPV